ncbi:hypothetical protein Bhyg_03960 [Pseudolycoriella hygida]|uniref:Uncharacterized protein n=1 Tax=Pseudolycoriella hygida TaxID=35572 RepID=A0A9Q0S7Y8_9DIPT|nr:hypothetical protein Bhyg_03960 [Pseudolycoriella hygida]
MKLKTEPKRKKIMFHITKISTFPSMLNLCKINLEMSIFQSPRFVPSSSDMDFPDFRSHFCPSRFCVKSVSEKIKSLIIDFDLKDYKVLRHCTVQRLEIDRIHHELHPRSSFPAGRCGRSHLSGGLSSLLCNFHFGTPFPLEVVLEICDVNSARFLENNLVGPVTSRFCVFRLADTRNSIKRRAKCSVYRVDNRGSLYLQSLAASELGDANHE